MGGGGGGGYFGGAGGGGSASSDALNGTPGAGGGAGSSYVEPSAGDPSITTATASQAAVLSEGPAQDGGVLLSWSPSEPPTATIEAPASGGTYYQGESVPTSFSCSDSAGVSELASCDDLNGKDTTSGGTGILDTSTVGQHSYWVLATSKGGQYNEATIYYIVAAPPTVTITNPSSSGTPTFAHNSTAHLSFSCADGIGGPGLTSCDGYVDDNRLDEPTNTASGGAGLLYTPQVGTYEYTVTATSKDGATASERLYYNVADPPTATIISPARSTDGDPIYLQYEEALTAFECAEGTGGTGLIDCSDGRTGGTTGTIAGSLDTAATGQHSYTATATSGDGLTGATTLTYTVIPPGGDDSQAIAVSDDLDAELSADVESLESAADQLASQDASQTAAEERQFAAAVGLTEGQINQISVANPSGVSSTTGANLLRSLETMDVPLNADLTGGFLDVPDSAAVTPSKAGGCKWDACARRNYCVAGCDSYDPTLKVTNGKAELARAFRRSTGASELSRAKSAALKNAIAASENAESVLRGIRVTRSELIGASIAHNARGVGLQTAMLAALDGELAGWLQERNGWCRVLAAVVRVQHGAKRTA
ncbi:MAG: hypothetical protein ACRDNS_22725, partial [Trebonia sp.]